LTKKVVYISDFFAEHVLGGAEINDNVLLTEVLDADIERVRSHVVSVELLKNNINNLFIISNFINLSKNCKEYLQNNCKYIIYEHDHKYLISRNPGLFEDFKAPREEIVNLDFYTNALRIIAQSSFHKKIIEKNLNIKNVYSLGGNLWSEESLTLLDDLGKSQKNNACSVMRSNVAHKNTYEAVKFCKFKNIPYTLIESASYEEFLFMLSQNNQFAFFPKTPETLSRVVVEARMLGNKVYINKMIGAAHEDWFSLKGMELIEKMRNKKQQIRREISESIY